MIENVDAVRIELAGRRAVGLYLLLRRHEDELDGHTLAVLNDLERELFERLSIEDMERIEELYAGE
jgi:hypothetical protein